MINCINISDNLVGHGQPAYLIAEIGSNHCRSKEVIKKLIDEAYNAGFDAVKFQTYEPQDVFSAKITTRDVNYENLYGYKSWCEVAKDHILMPREWFGEMFDYIKDKNMEVFSTVHSLKDAKFIMQFDPPVFKVASIDVTYLDFLGELAKFNKPIILSTGMASIEEIKEAVDTILKNGNKQIILLHCISCYPPAVEHTNLRNIAALEELFNLPVGFSDHSPNNYLSIAAVTLGACVIEKHITLDRMTKGPDHSFALEPDLMKELVLSIREVERGLGCRERILSLAELESKKQIRRSVVSCCKILKGETFGRNMLKAVRPGTGIAPKFLNEIIGCKAKEDIDAESVITWEMVDKK